MDRLRASLRSPRRPRAARACLLALALLSARAVAQPPATEPEVSAPSPEQMSKAQAKGEELQARHTDLALLPGLNYSSATGVGFGLNGAIFVRDDGFRPYRYAAKLQLFITTRGVQDHELILDAPSIFRSPYRPQLFLGYFRDPIRPYFGIGNEAQPPAGFSDEQLDYTLSSIYVGFQLERLLAEHWKLTLIYDLRTLNMALHASSLLGLQHPVGTEGGRSGRADLELLYDTRDQEASPSRGLYLAASAHVAGTLLGSTFNYYGATGEARAFQALFGPRLVLGERLLADATAGDVPIAMLPLAGGRSRVELLGGSTSVRGLPRYRYEGKGKLLVNVELRSLIHRFTLFHRSLDLWGAAFVDTGRVWAELKPDGPFWNFHTGEGAGFRLAWVQDFVVRVDVAHAEGNWQFYGVLDQMF